MTLYKIAGALYIVSEKVPADMHLVFQSFNAGGRISRNSTGTKIAVSHESWTRPNTVGPQVLQTWRGWVPYDGCADACWARQWAVQL